MMMLRGSIILLIQLLRGSNEFLPNTSNIHTNVFYDILDNLFIAGEGSETDETFEDAPFDFDPIYPPMDRWTQSHPYKQIIGDP